MPAEPPSPTAANTTPPALDAPRGARDNPLTRSVAGMIGIGFLAAMFLLCVATLPYTLGPAPLPPGAPAGSMPPPRFDAQDRSARHLRPTWAPVEGAVVDPAAAEADGDTAAKRLYEVAYRRALEEIARKEGTSVAALREAGVTPTPEQVRAARPFYLMGTDILGRDVFIRVLAGGGISLGIGLAAAMISVFVGTLYGAVAGYAGGRVDAVMMRIVDILYGLPYILLVVLLAVAGDAVLDEYISRTQARAGWVVAQARAEMPAEGASRPTREAARAWLAANPDERARLEARAQELYPPRNVSERARRAYDVVILLVAIGGVSWLTMARVIRGQVLSLKTQPFMEAARAIGAPLRVQFVRHLLPNLMGPVIVYATLTVPQAILQESFLSFLGIGVRPPLPSWGNLAAEGLTELNPYKSNWWLLLFPCLLLGTTLLALNFVGEGLREAFDPRRSRR